MKKLNVYIFLFAFSILSVFLSSSSFAFMDEIPEGLSVKTQYAESNGNIIGVVELGIASDYYAYAPGNGQNVGLPTQLIAKSAEGKILPSYLPAGIERFDYYEKDKRILAYAGNVVLFADLGKWDKDAIENSKVDAELSMLLCSKEHCLPVRVPLNFTLPMSMPPSLEKQNYAELFQKAFARGNANAGLVLEQSAPEAEQGGSGKLQGKLASLSNSSTELSESDGNVSQASGNALATNSWNFSPQAFSQSLEVSTLSKALLLGLLAGLILNLMPCVLPVLTLKMHSLLRAEDGPERIQAFRTHNLFFAAGIICQFLLLAFILGSAQLMWGELFQNVYFVASMLVIIFALALSLLGIFNLPMLDLKSSVSTSPRRQAFITGMVATLLATPCSGPLLGGVLSWALLQPLYLVLLIITAVGVGMSLPYFLFALKPQCVRFLPKPGAWMGVLERLVAFFLLGTALYIFSIMPSYAYIPMLFALLVLAFCAWIWGHFGGLNAPAWRRRALAGLFMLSLVGAVVYGVKEPTQDTVAWQDFNGPAFSQQLGKKAMVVEFTADWCPNCKFVEKTALTQENLLKWQKKYGVTFVKVDFTRDNIDGEALLHALGSKSIPFTAIFGLGEDAQKPIVIRDIYSAEDMEIALQQALDK